MGEAAAHQPDPPSTDRLARAAIDVVGMPVVVLDDVRDASGRIVDLLPVYANPAAISLFGVQRTGMIGRPLLDAWPPLSDSANLRRAIDPGRRDRPWSFRVATDVIAGRHQLIEGVVHPIDGGGLVVLLQDVTEREREREARSEAEEIYRTLLEALPDRVVVVVDDDLAVLLLSGQAVPRLGVPGVPGEAVTGRALRDVLGAEGPGIELLARSALAGEHVVDRQLSFAGRTWRVDGAPMYGRGGRVGSAMLVALEITDRVRAQVERNRMLWELQQAQRIARTGSWRWDADTGELWWSEGLRRLLGVSPSHPPPGVEEVFQVLDRTSPDGAQVRAAWERAVTQHEPFQVVHRLRRSSGALQYLAMHGEVILDRTGRVRGVRGITQDVTEQHVARQALAESEERFRLAFEESPIGKALLSPRPEDFGRLLRVNRALCRLLGAPPDQLIGTILWDWVDPDDREAARASVRFAPPDPDDPTPYRTEVRLSAGSSGGLWAGVGATAISDVDGSPLYLLAQIEDVTARREAETELIRQARFDQLTGLPNRAALIEHLEALLDSNDPHVAVLFLDLDDFKTVNDSLGHVAGDALLERVAVHLRAGLQPGEFAARWGGDEFVVVSPGVRDELGSRALADRVRTAVCEQVSVDGHDLTATASVGVAIGGTGSTPEGLLRDADIAMYRAKAGGKDRWAPADSTGHAGAMRRLTLASALRHALERDQLCLQYQPVVDIVTGEVLSVEALLRWRHPQRGLLHPAEFLDVAESSALIVPFGEWALHAACAQAVAWRRRFGDRGPAVAVNVSSRQLGENRLHAKVEDALVRSGLPAHRLCLELTEREAVATSGVQARDLQTVHEAGVRLAVDDFGAGYAGMDYLRRFSVDILKIDRSFVDGLGADSTDTAIVVSLITLGRALDVTVVAEGVEHEGALQMLRRLECPQGQGTLWSPPVDPHVIDAMLAGVDRSADGA